MTVVGFTGTQRGMTKSQKAKFIDVLMKLKPDKFHHGDCVGADAQAHEVALMCSIPIIIHPPIESAKRAFCKGAMEVRIPKPYLDRDRDIVRESDYLIATPNGKTEVNRSGTWYTVRQARKAGISLIIIYPDGSVNYES